jgi:hypothetical protein
VTDRRLTWSEPDDAYVKPCFIEIESSEPILKASKPTPADDSLHFDTWVIMSWSAGETAVSHNVYMSDDLDAVADADTTSEAFQGNQTALEFMAGFPGFAFPEGLVTGTTYYWRIDEVEADGATVHQGDVWSFSLPPKTAYDLAVLTWLTSYYWRVDEVDSQGNTDKGPVWSFTSADFLLVDDFEGYTDDDAAGESI